MLRFLLALLLFCLSGVSHASQDCKSYNLANEIVVQADNAQIFCRVFGEGDPIIVLHGGPGLSQDYLLPYMTRLAKTHRVIFYDQRGCGRSTCEITGDTIHIKTFLSDIEAVRQYFGYDTVTILGHSWGGFLAMQYAIAHPDMVHKLILLNTMAPSSEEFSLFLQEWEKRMAPCQAMLKAIQAAPGFAAGDPTTIERYYQIVFEKYCHNPTKAHLLYLRRTPGAFIDGSKVYEILRQNLFTQPFNLHKPLQQLTMPTLIVHGDCDPIPASVAQRLHESMRHSQYVLLENCGHFPYVEAPEELFSAIHDFLR